MTLTGDWTKAAQWLGKAAGASGKILDQALAQEARELEKVWVDGIRKNVFKLKPISSLTSGAKGSSTPLIDRGDLVGSIHRKKIAANQKASSWFVGVSKNAKDRDGKSLVDIALVHELGAPSITPKRAKALAIPMTKQAARVGSPRQYPSKLIFIPFKNRGSGNGIGGLYVARQLKTRTKFDKMVYMLVKKVTIPPRPTRQPALDKWRPAARLRIMRKMGQAFKRL